MLTTNELRETMSSARHSLFRLETLDRYEVPIDGSDLSVYLAGGDQPHNPEKLAWQEHLRAGRRVHLVVGSAPAISSGEPSRRLNPRGPIGPPRAPT